MTETAVGADLLQALKVLTGLAVETVGNNLRVLAVGDIALSVKEPRWDLVLGRGLEDGDDALKLFGGEFTSTKKKVSISIPAASDKLCCVNSAKFATEASAPSPPYRTMLLGPVVGCPRTSSPSITPRIEVHGPKNCRVHIGVVIARTAC